MNETFLVEAREWHKKHGKLSIPFLQRKLQINYTKSKELIKLIEKEVLLKNLNATDNI